MDWFKKQKWSNWIILILIIFNITTLVTLWSLKPDRAKDGTVMNMRRERHIMNFLSDELSFNESQSNNFRTMRKKHFIKIQKISRQINTLRHEIMETIAQETPDTVKIQMLSKKMGLLHADREMNNARHFLGLRKICNTGQRANFKHLIRNLTPGRQGGRRQNGRPGRHGNKSY